MACLIGEPISARLFFEPVVAMSATIRSCSLNRFRWGWYVQYVGWQVMVSGSD